MRINYKALLENYAKQTEENGTETANRLIQEAFKEKYIRPRDFDLGELFSECFGYDRFRECRRSKETLANKVMEAAGAVQASAFTQISGQIVFNEILEAYENPEYIIQKMIPTIPTKFSGERIAGITPIGDEATEVPEGENFPLAGVGQDWIDTPPTKKRGMIVAVTREAIFFDRTGVLLERCQKVGEWLGMNKEKRACQALLDVGPGATSAPQGGHRYHWRDASYATYQASTPWINIKTSNALNDWTNINEAEQQFNNMRDPVTGEPIMISPEQIIVHQANLHQARRLITATENRTAVGGYATSGNLTTVVAPNTIKTYTIVSSPILSKQMTDYGYAVTTWLMANVGKAIRYMENFPMQVLQAPTGMSEEFNRDIVTQFRADERGAYTTFQPRLLQKNTA